MGGLSWISRNLYVQTESDTPDFVNGLVAEAFAAWNETINTISGAQRGDEVGAMARALTGLREAVRTAFRLKQMVEMMPIKVMMTDTEDFQVTYANKTSLDTLKGLEHVLPVKAEDIVGSSIDIFTRTQRINGRSSPIPATCRTRRRSNWATRRWTSASPRSTTRTVPISARC